MIRDRVTNMFNLFILELSSASTRFIYTKQLLYSPAVQLCSSLPTCASSRLCCFCHKRFSLILRISTLRAPFICLLTPQVSAPSLLPSCGYSKIKLVPRVRAICCLLERLRIILHRAAFRALSPRP
jgi:hypothetical protein